MKRSEMVKRLATYIYDCNEARASDTLRFLENQGMMPRDYVWDLEEELNPTTAEEQVKTLVAEHMGWADDQVRSWYYTINPLLGGLTPNDMVCQGRHDKLIKWIKNQIDENQMEEQDKELYAKHLALPKLPQKGAVKKLNALSKARRKVVQTKFKRHRKKT